MNTLIELEGLDKRMIEIAYNKLNIEKNIIKVDDKEFIEVSELINIIVEFIYKEGE